MDLVASLISTTKERVCKVWDVIAKVCEDNSPQNAILK